MTEALPMRTPADILAAVPYLLGFHPSESIVVLGLRHHELIFQLRGDLPERDEVDAYARYYADLVARQRVSRAILIGYGTEEATRPVLTATRDRLDSRLIRVPEMLRALDGRYWSGLCGPGCCPPEGIPYEVATNPIATAATVSGCVALPSRAHLERRLAPVTGAERTAMREATVRAARRLSDLVGPDIHQGAVAVRRAGAVAVDSGLARVRDGGRLDDEEMAWLGILLGHLPVRDHAWRRIGGDLGPQVALWTDAVRRLEPALTAPPATLLGFAAWRGGEGAVATIALARALEVDPNYRMALLLNHALRHGLSPVEWDSAMRDASWDQAAIRTHRTSRPRLRRSTRRPVRTAQP